MSTRLSEFKVRLLDAAQAKRGDPDRATTIEAALDQFIEAHFPGALAEHRTPGEGA